MVLVGDRVPTVATGGPIPTWRLSEIEGNRWQTQKKQCEPVCLAGNDVAEIVFTSGTTGESKGVVITHRNLAAQIRPIEEQIAALSQVCPTVRSHTDSQSSTDEPPFRPIARDFCATAHSGFP